MQRLVEAAVIGSDQVQVAVQRGKEYQSPPSLRDTIVGTLNRFEPHAIAVRTQPAHEVVACLAGGLIASCQPVRGGVFDRPELVALFALAALDGGAVGLRVESLADLRAVRGALDAASRACARRPRRRNLADRRNGRNGRGRSEK